MRSRKKFNRWFAKKRLMRRGFSMVEMTLVLIISSFLIQSAVLVATSYTRKKVVQSTAATLSVLGDDIETYIDRNYFEILGTLGSSPGATQEINLATLIGANRISTNEIPVMPDKGELRAFLTLRGGDTIYAVLLSHNGLDVPISPKPDPLVRLAGRVDGAAPDTLRGYEFSLPIPQIQAQLGGDIVNSVGVIRYISRVTDVDPYLHRIPMPDVTLNTMEGDLNMGGFNIINVDNLLTETMNVTGELEALGEITTPIFTSTGDVILESFTAEDAQINILASDTISADSLIMPNGRLITDTADINIIDANSSSIRDLSTIQFNAQTLFFQEGNFINIDAETVNSEEVITDRIFIGD